LGIGEDWGLGELCFYWFIYCGVVISVAGDVYAGELGKTA
jgi:hypothetical protein